jgi:RNA polymerase sigma factor (sigma-70 family)
VTDFGVGPSTEELPDRMCRLESAAFEEFSTTFLPTLRSFFQHGGLSAAEAEDLAVNCVSDVCLQIGRYRRYPGIAFVAWVFSIARHRRADWQRKNFKSPRPVPLDDVIEAYSLPYEDCGADPLVAEAVRDAINRLSRLQRTILELVYKGIAKNSTEIGKILRMPSGTVRVQHLRARQRIKAMLVRDPRMNSRLRRVRSETVGA